MLKLEQQTVMRLSDAYLTIAEATTIALYAAHDMVESGTDKQKEAGRVILELLESRNCFIERKDEKTRMMFRDYDVPEVEEGHEPYYIEFYVDGSELAYIIYKGASDESIEYGSWTVSELKKITNVHLGTDCCATNEA